MIGYADDSNCQTNVVQTNEHATTAIQTLVHQFQYNAQIWANILGASGGAIEIPKCSYQIMELVFSKQSAPVLTHRHVTDV